MVKQKLWYKKQIREKYLKDQKDKQLKLFNSSAIKIQKMFRKYKSRIICRQNLKLILIQVKLMKKNKAALKIQRAWKNYLLKVEISKRIEQSRMRTFERKVVKIQSLVRRLLAKKT